MARPGLPAPDYDTRNTALLEGAKAGKLLLPKCQTCGKLLAPPLSNCTNCLNEGVEWVEASGKGTVYSYIIYHRAWVPEFSDYLPYNVAVIELDEGLRIISNVLCDEPELQVGLAVEVAFEDRGEWKIPVFVPAH